MPLSGKAEGELLANIESELALLEAACADAERGLMQGEWENVSAALRDQRRLTHALGNAMFAAKDVRTKEFDSAIFKRLGIIGVTRDAHIARLKKYQDDITARLATVNRWKSASRKLLSGYDAGAGRGIGRVDQVR